MELPRPCRRVSLAPAAESSSTPLLSSHWDPSHCAETEPLFSAHWVGEREQREGEGGEGEREREGERGGRERGGERERGREGGREGGRVVSSPDSSPLMKRTWGKSLADRPGGREGGRERERETSLPHSSSAEDDISLSFTLASGQAQIDSSLSGAIHT